MTNESIKAMLLDIEASKLDFSVTLTGKKSKKVNGLYKPDTFEILLHNKNFDSDTLLVYTAIHEYTHHLLNEEMRERGGVPAKHMRFHTGPFWARFHGLLDIAGQKGYYVLDVEQSPELAALTKNIRENYLSKNGELMRAFGGLLVQAEKLCEAAKIRFEDYIDRVLCLPRSAARSLTKISALELNPALGYDNMRLVAGIGGAEAREAAQEQLLAGKSPDTVFTNARKPRQEEDPRASLEQEKKRLERTIATLTSRLEQVEDRLSGL